jgi:hypothetical protein
MEVEVENYLSFVGCPASYRGRGDEEIGACRIRP